MIHLSNVKVNEELEKYHYPVLPRLSTREGWAPVEEYLHIIRKENPNVNIMFEHRSDLISDAELEKCYLWVQMLLKIRLHIMKKIIKNPNKLITCNNLA